MAYRVSGISRKLTVPIAATACNAAPRHVGAWWIRIIPPLAFNPRQPSLLHAPTILLPGTNRHALTGGSQCAPEPLWNDTDRIILPYMESILESFPWSPRLRHVLSTVQLLLFAHRVRRVCPTLQRSTGPTYVACLVSARLHNSLEFLVDILLPAAL